MKGVTWSLLKPALVLSLISAVLIQPVSALSVGKVYAQYNSHLVTDQAELYSLARPFAADSKMDIQTGSQYFIKDNILYKPFIKSKSEITQDVKESQVSSNTITNYRTDVFADVSMAKAQLTPSQVEALGNKNNSEIPESAVESALGNSLLVWTNQGEDAAYSLKIQYSVNYDYISSDDGLNNLYELSSSTGTILYYGIASGVYPTSASCYYSEYGKALYITSSGTQSLGTKSNGNRFNTSIAFPISVTTYNYTLNPNYYYQVTASHSVGTSWTVNATRGVSVVVSFQP